MVYATLPNSGQAFKYASRNLGLMNSIGAFPSIFPTWIAISLSVVCLSPRLRYEMNIGDANRVCVSFLSGLFIQQEYTLVYVASRRKSRSCMAILTQPCRMVSKGT